MICATESSPPGFPIHNEGELETVFVCFFSGGGSRAAFSLHPLEKIVKISCTGVADRKKLVYIRLTLVNTLETPFKVCFQNTDAVPALPNRPCGSPQGSMEPPLRVTLIATSIGPTINPDLEAIAWGSTPCLVDAPRELRLSNFGKIPAPFKIFLRSSSSKFRVNVREGVLAPSEVKAIEMA